ncbi:hypothetical protein [Planctomyces sp. SH-PL62]|uniref:hypothetical protein n=1 Tax=Planctomyces sp. SH-PL62 TaxID=1636152 RepID=UPI00078D760C|nr:hypothetical protein [Planctomyces sp. SH-PL62]AMV36915.1 hypothetical protein VT85_05755 [Planctomyces sp. SH-PL62]
MSTVRTRREFFGNVGRGMLVASVGLGTAFDMGLTPAWADDGGERRISFGGLEPLVALMQETSADRIVPTLVEKLRGGTDLKQLVAAAALANARTFGGEDYIGFHTLMALAPALHMAGELPEGRRALPVLKVLHRNTNRIQEHGGPSSEVLQTVQPSVLSAGQEPGETLRDAVRRRDLDGAERTFAAIAAGSPDEAFNSLLVAVEDNTEVHRVVLPYRAWELLDVVGKDQAHTMLRQSVRYCVKSERTQNHGAVNDEVRTLLPRLFDQHHLPRTSPGTKRPGDEWVASMCRTLFDASPASAADAVAAALAEGIDPGDVGEAIALAANQLVLRDAGRPERYASPGKPPGSVHGDSIGVHASDAVNAWRNMARVANPRNSAACLILAAYEVARDRQGRDADFHKWSPRPLAEYVDGVTTEDSKRLLAETESAIRANQQEIASAMVHRYGTLGHDPAPVFALMLKYAVSEDGALHAEKYYNTVREEFASTRPAFRWRQLVALARVTASECGRPAPGVAQAEELLKA